MKEDQIKIIFRKDVLILYAGMYSKEVPIPKGIFEMEKTYKNGILEIILR
jgi:hypothetical protein